MAVLCLNFQIYLFYVLIEVFNEALPKLSVFEIGFIFHDKRIFLSPNQTVRQLHKITEAFLLLLQKGVQFLLQLAIFVVIYDYELVENLIKEAFFFVSYFWVIEVLPHLFENQKEREEFVRF